ncbi:MAG TPA: ABC transporter ATP-binding protein [Gammaproteobacteria bacterium]|jgi:sulfate-transporting ATPase/ATP-binding cassette subfamily B protein|nr:ABC transporter ATP-binding protein [Gammaproteobacteria bacterium]
MSAAPRVAASLRDLIGLMATERRRLGYALCLTVVAALCDLIPYGLLYLALETVLSGQAVASGLTTLACWMTLALLAKYALYTVAYLLSHQAAFALLAHIRQDLARRIAWSPWLWLHRFSSGELKKIIMQDVERLEQFIAHHSVEMMAALVSPLFVTLFLAWLDWRLALAALAVVPVAVLAQYLFMRGMQARYAEFEAVSADLNGAIVEYVRNAAVMKAFQQDTASFQRLRTALDAHSRLIAEITRRTVPGWSVFAVLLGANVFFILPVGIGLHTQGSLALTDLILALVLGSGMLKPLFKVVRFSSEIQEIRMGVARMLPFLQWQPPVQNTRDMPQPPVIVCCDQVSFSFGHVPTVRSVDLSLAPGTTTALIGPSGAGKSTLAQLLAGLLSPTSGDIRVNHTPLSTLDDRQRCALIALASQEAFLFRGTLLDNLRLGCPGAGDEAIATSLRVAQAEAFVNALPQGLHTSVGERGVRLSGGERQRIAIARALLADTPVLILDEATAFADARTERAFHGALRETYADKTLLVITHRLHAIERADCVVVMAQGQLVDSGPHAALLQRCPLYQRLWHRQRASQRWTLAVHPSHPTVSHS